MAARVHKLMSRVSASALHLALSEDMQEEVTWRDAEGLRLLFDLINTVGYDRARAEYDVELRRYQRGNLR